VTTFAIREFVGRARFHVGVVMLLAVAAATHSNPFLLAQQDTSASSGDDFQRVADKLNERMRAMEQEPPSEGNPATATSVKWNEPLSLLLDPSPVGRHRFYLPRTIPNARVGVDALVKLLEKRKLLEEWRDGIDDLAGISHRGALAAESQRDWEQGYRLRWQAVGLQSVLAGPKTKTADSWTHSSALLQTPQLVKSFSNHPKAFWPAGSFSVATTAHFEIASQAGDKPTRELAEICEQAYAIWKQLFFSVWADEQTVAPEYPEREKAKYSVVLFRDQAAYVKSLKGASQNIGISTGYYDPTRKLSIFYWDGAKTSATVVHELVHQFFNEGSAREVAFNTDDDAGYWIAEGIALYVESMSQIPCGGMLIADVGGWDSLRLQAGRYRRLHDQYWIPWSEFSTVTGKRVRDSKEIKAWYSQACGLTHFWMDGSEDKRDKLIRYIQSVYSGAADRSQLAEWDDDDRLREEYDEYLRLGASKEGQRAAFVSRKDVVLSRCDINVEQLLAWPVALRSMGWLDVSFTDIDDRLFSDAGDMVAPMWNVSRLSLESTKVTDASLPAIATIKDLAELDLSSCAISDNGLDALKGNKTLRSIWLTDCTVSDACLEILVTMPQLELVDVGRTKITKGAWERFLTRKPRAKSKSNGP
jgi:hypothetical protein